MECVTEIQLEWQASRQAAMKQEIEKGVRDIVGQANSVDTEFTAQQLSEKLRVCMDRIIASAEEKLTAASGRLPTGNIELNNRNHEEKLVQLFLLLKEVKAPPQIAKSEQLFKHFADIDIVRMPEIG